MFATATTAGAAINIFPQGSVTRHLMVYVISAKPADIAGTVSTSEVALYVQFAPQLRLTEGVQLTNSPFRSVTLLHASLTLPRPKIVLFEKSAKL